jgi:hypothetical protein
MLQSYAAVLYAYVCYSLIRLRSICCYSSSMVVLCYSLIRIRMLQSYTHTFYVLL